MRSFGSAGAFASFLTRLAAEEIVADTLGRGRAAELLAKEARDRIGQPEKLPPPLAESTQQERVRLGFSPDETLLRTGQLRDSIGWSHEGERTTAVGSTDPIAVYHEFGGEAGRPPQRSFLVSTLHEHNDAAYAVYLEGLRTLFLR